MEQKNQNAQLAYQVTRIRTASREQLLLITYDIAIRFCIAAESAIAKGNTEESHENLLRAQNAVRELMVSLNVEVGGSVAEDLMGLYDFMHRSLVEANVEKSKEKVAMVRSMLEELRDTWQEALEKIKKEAISKKQEEPVPSGGGVSFAG
ncbi:MULTISPECIES: flagellar export chaperone FliS [Dethiosulfovibrio]|uniref:Flagellar secretion chaperone FliS n=2 Tax=Dethiosulfovibrio TaxID=47054 RepID=A0ABS9EQ77_9BACT|nr:MULTISPECIES: flagellar export chaperone FliS [Dethiosulfovibrio]MCF4115031.1 flagellar export chaperone FliS [Dethiosulfovibrio russensis]MCF4143354.1 flagellar export chaperone FliS [Dethiosulfovibrio marinus]MCF4145527.1 flagellar export chaperone FliS [Dethiosulfovibrio acidaminovorans]